MTLGSALSKDWGKIGVSIGMSVGVLLALALVCLITFRMMFVNFVDNYELGYKFDSRTGAISVLHESGYYVTPPFVVSIHTIDMRPMQVCINANSRVLNCKLVQFDPKGIELFLSWHGRSSYSGPGGNTANSGNFSEILKSYAYDGSGKSYSFLRVIRELKPEESAESTQK